MWLVLEAPHPSLALPNGEVWVLSPVIFAKPPGPMKRSKHSACRAGDQDARPSVVIVSGSAGWRRSRR